MTTYNQLNGIFVRDGEDKEMVKESFRNYSCINFLDNDVVVDLGMNIGSFGVIALRKNPNIRYVGYEPLDDNFNMAKLNLPNQADLYKAAVSHLGDKTLTFSVRRNCSSTLFPKQNRKDHQSITVQNICIDEVIERFQPTVLKIDIEGAEEYLFEHWKHVIPECIRVLSIEVHAKKYSKYFEEVTEKSLLKTHKRIFSNLNTGFLKKSGVYSELFGQTYDVNSTIFGADLVYERIV